MYLVVRKYLRPHIIILLTLILTFTGFSNPFNKEPSFPGKQAKWIKEAKAYQKDKYGHYIKINKVIAEDSIELVSYPVRFSLNGVSNYNLIRHASMCVTTLSYELVNGCSKGMPPGREFVWNGLNNENNIVSHQIPYYAIIDLDLKNGDFSRLQRLITFERKDMELYMLRVPEIPVGVPAPYIPPREYSLKVTTKAGQNYVGQVIGIIADRLVVEVEYKLNTITTKWEKAEPKYKQNIPLSDLKNTQKLPTEEAIK